MPESAKIIGNYEVLALIGDGAEGRVYKARCIAEGLPGVSCGEFVALKRLRNTGHEKESFQFRRQTEILRKLNHPHIVQYRDSFVWREKESEEELYFLVVEWLEGETLKALLEKNPGGLPWEQTQVIFTQTLQALEYAKKNQQVVHRDLKPSNIYVTKQGVAKLIDFGIALHLDSDASSSNSAAGIKGSFDYMAPDFARLEGGFQGDEQSDVFSFGVCLYHALTGHLPLPTLENGIMGYFSRWLEQANHQPPEVAFRDPVFKVLLKARSCIAKCIDPSREGRFKSFTEVLADFAKVGYRKLRLGEGGYEFVEWLGKGGFGEVFRARRLLDGREVAVKRLFSARHSARFLREARILREAVHPHLIEYVDFVEVRQHEDEPDYFLVLEYLTGMPGASLRGRIRSSESGMPLQEVLTLFAGYLDCLDHLHQRGIIHRDIKPGNLYAPVEDPQNGKIMDLGIAYDEEGTRTHGQVPGTLDYMPPEFATQNQGRGSAQSDIYSIGITLFEALTKQLPFPRLPSAEAEALAAFFKRSEAPPECSFSHPIFVSNPEVISILGRALAAIPTLRYPNARTMREDICRILSRAQSSNDESSATPLTTAPKEESSPKAFDGFINSKPNQGPPESDQGFGFEAYADKSRRDETPAENESPKDPSNSSPTKHQVFISHSSKNAEVAKAVCRGIEQRGVSCWIAPRDVFPGANYAEALLDAINACRLFVLLLTKESNESPQVIHEVERAASQGITIIPFRIQNVKLSKPLEFFISTHHWVNAETPPLEPHIEKLADQIHFLLAHSSRRKTTSGDTAKPPPVKPEPFKQAMAEPARLVGASVGNYILDKPVSAGGSGLVYTAHHRTLPHEACVKIFYPFREGLSAIVTAMSRGIRAVASINHPCIIKILDFSFLRILETSTFYLVMEYVDGKTLDQWNRDQTLNHSGFVARLRLAHKLVTGFHVAHISRYLDESGFEQCGILHGDIKPGNIMVRPDNSPVIMDFMLVDVLKLSGDPKAQEDDDDFERPTSVFGTDGFMSPEQASKSILTVKSDVFSLGIVLQGLFSGFDAPSRGFDSEQGLAALYQEISTIIAPMLSANPQSRPDSMQVVAERLERFAVNHGIPLGPEFSTARKKWWRMSNLWHS